MTSDPDPDDGRALDRIFAVLADPTRRQLLLDLVREGPDTATRLAAPHAMTRQAIVKHLQALADAGLVVGERRGREVRYRATTERLADAVSWLLGAGPAWDRRLDRLQDRVGGRSTTGSSRPSGRRPDEQGRGPDGDEQP